jgi:hypothetical protein
MAEQAFDSVTPMEPTVEISPTEGSPLNSASLLLRSAGGKWNVPATTAWTSEAALRDLLTDNPTVLPGVTDLSVAAVSEYGISGVGRADVVTVESSGAVTVCEAKLSANTEMRRTIIGQVFAYASAFAGLTFEAFDAGWSACAQGRSVLDDVLGDDATEDDRLALRAAITSSLTEGRIRIVVAVDSLTDELRRIIGYLAKHDLDVVALELAYASRGDTEILVPRTWGTELSSAVHASPSQGKSPGYRRSIEEARAPLVASANAIGPSAVLAVTTVLDRLADRVAYLYSGSPDMLDPVLVVRDPIPCQPAKIRTTLTRSKPGVRVCFFWCRKIPRNQLEAALERLEQHDAIAPLVSEVRAADFRKGPLLTFVGVLDQPGAVDALTDSLRIMVG